MPRHAAKVKMVKVGGRDLIEPGCIKAATPVYDALQDFLFKYRAMDRAADVAFGKMIKGSGLTDHGPVGVEIARVLRAYSPFLAHDAVRGRRS